MRTSWADSVNSEEKCGDAPTRPARSSYVPPHLRQRPQSDGSAISGTVPGDGAPSGGQKQSLFGNPPVPQSTSRWGGGPVRDSGNPYYSGGGGGRGTGSGGWSGRGGGWDRGRDREVNPFANDDPEPEFAEENTGINFDAYEDIPVETSGQNVPAAVNSFAEIDLGDALNDNIRRCKYVKPTPVQKHAIPISLEGRDLMACAQTGSGKTAAFCFPIISGIMKGQSLPHQQRGMRTAYPLALILSPTRELSCQVRFQKLLGWNVGFHYINLFFSFNSLVI